MLELAGRFFSARMFFLQLVLFSTLSLDNLDSTTSRPCADPAVFSTGRRHDVRPAWCRGQLLRVAIVFSACCRTLAQRLLSVRPTFRLAYSHGVRPDFHFFVPHSSYVSLCFGEINLSTDFRLPLWAIPHNDPVHAVCWGFSTDRATAWIDCSYASSELLSELTVHIAHHRPRVNAVFLVFYRTFTDRLAAASDAY